MLTIAHRRSVDRVRSAQAGADRERRVAAASTETPYDDVIESVTASLEQQQIQAWTLRGGAASDAGVLAPGWTPTPSPWSGREGRRLRPATPSPW